MILSRGSFFQKNDINFTRLSVAMAFAPATLKTVRFMATDRSRIQRIYRNLAAGSSLVPRSPSVYNRVRSGYEIRINFLPFDCHCDAINEI